jgi:outer membrane protein
MKTVILFLWLSLWTASLLPGQNQKILTFSEAVQIALDKNVSLKQENNRLLQNKGDVLQSYGNFLPNAGISASTSRTTGQQFDQIRGQVVTQSVDRLNAGLDVSWTVFNGFGRLHNVNRVQHLYSGQEQQVVQTRQWVIYTVAVQFLQVLMDEKLIEIAEQNFENQKLLNKRIKELVDLGIRPATDLYTQEAEMKRLELALLQAKNQLVGDKATLMQTLQLDPRISVHCEILEPKVIQKTFSEIDLDRLYQIALDNRPDYKRLKQTSSGIKREIGFAHSAYMPQVSLFYFRGSNYSSFQERPMKTQLFNDNIFAVAGVSVFVPIFNGYQVRNRVIGAKVAYENNRLAERQLEQGIYTEVLTAYHNYDTALKGYQVCISQFTAAAKAQELQQERYKLGLGSLIELSEANRNLLRSESDQVQARYLLLFQDIMLSYFTGTLNADIPEWEI